jgi:hypothetical protein
MPNAEQFMLTLSEHQTIQPVLVGVYMAHALVLVVFVSNYALFYFLSDTNNVWKVLYKVSSFYANWMKNMAA